MKAIQVEEMAQQAQQADTQKDLQLNEQVAQITQLQQKIEVLQQQMRNRGNVIVLHLKIYSSRMERFIFRRIVRYRNCVFLSKKYFKMKSKMIFDSRQSKWVEK